MNQNDIDLAIKRLVEKQSNSDDGVGDMFSRAWKKVKSVVKSVAGPALAITAPGLAPIAGALTSSGKKKKKKKHVSAAVSVAKKLALNAGVNFQSKEAENILRAQIELEQAKNSMLKPGIILPIIAGGVLLTVLLTRK
jgi:hypothetical protein